MNKLTDSPNMAPHKQQILQINMGYGRKFFSIK